MAFFPLKKIKISSVWEKLYRVVPVILFLGLIYYTSSLTFSSSESVGLPDYILHCCEFSALGLFTARMLTSKSTQKGPLLFILSALLFVIGCGWLDEIHQSFVPTREQSVQDLIADAIGGLCGIVAYLFLSRGPKHNHQ